MRLFGDRTERHVSLDTVANLYQRIGLFEPLMLLQGLAWSGKKINLGISNLAGGQTTFGQFVSQYPHGIAHIDLYTGV